MLNTYNDVVRGHRRGNAIEHIRGKTCLTLFLFLFSAIVHILISEINCIMYQNYISRSFEPFPSRVCDISWSSRRTFFSVVSHAGNVYVFCACVTIKKGGASNIYWLGSQTLLIFVINTFKKYYFLKVHTFIYATKIQWAMEKISFYERCAN